MVTDNALAAGQAAQDPSVELVGEPFTHEPYGVAMNMDDTDLVRRVNKVLDDYRGGRRAERTSAGRRPTAGPGRARNATVPGGGRRCRRSAEPSRRTGGATGGRARTRTTGEVIDGGPGSSTRCRCMGREEVDRRWTRLGAEYEAVETSLLALQDHAGRRLLEGAELTGATKERWAAAERADHACCGPSSTRTPRRW